MSPGSALRFPFLATSGSSGDPVLGGVYRIEVDPAARCVDAPDLNANGIAEPDGAAGLRPVEDRAELVELPPVAAQASHGQQALVALAERDEGPHRRQPYHLAVEHRVVAELEQLAREQEA